MSIAILTPSRGRPERFAEMVEAIRSTAQGEVEVYCGLDYDDPTRDRYPDDPAVQYVFASRKPLVKWSNALAEIALEDGHEILGSLGDDHQPRTEGWDHCVWQAMHLQFGNGLVYCDDGYQHENLPTAPFWSADVIRALGFYAPPELTHMYADDFWKHLANAIDRRSYLADVLIEHMHPVAQKAQFDESYRESDSFMAEDRLAWHRLFESPRYDEMVLRVQAAIEGRA